MKLLERREAKQTTEDNKNGDDEEIYGYED